jgi:DNA polymerase
MITDATPAEEASQDDYASVVDALHAYVEFALSTGIEDFRRVGPPPAPADHPALPAPVSARAPAAVATRPPTTSTQPKPATLQAPRQSPPVTTFAAATTALAAPVDLSGTTTLEDVRSALGDCTRCKLCSGRTHIVFGVGNPNADLMFVGEGPGRDEDLQAEPFVGRAGQLLTDIITKGMKLQRSDVYIANVVKCRPPNNRDPEPDEIAACRPFLQRQIELVRPKILVALGRFAAQTMLGTTVPISRLRGTWHEYAGIKLMPTLHPAYLLRNPEDKKLVWDDIQKVMGELGLSR